jgi:GNAT superfamily N-acetyltransferase
VSNSFPVVDLALARRLERAEGAANAAYVEARREVHPHVGAAWIEIGGVYAMFDGVASPVTQTFGLGIFDRVHESQLDRLEAFFTERGASTSHEVSSFAAPETFDLLSARGYSPIEASAVLVLPTAAVSRGDDGLLTVREIGETEGARWSRVAAQGWSSESAELGQFIEDIGAVVTRARGVRCFLAELEGEPIAAASLNISNGVALLAGASTIPTARRRGAQRALLRARLEFAAAGGIDLAMLVALPGSASQRNAQRQGFRPVYVRSKWTSARVPAPADGQATAR